jgi:hypothetical protein
MSEQKYLINNDNIIEKIILLMNEAESYKNYTGEQKKVYVMNKVKTHIDNATYERYLPLIECIIDGIVKISRKELVIALNKTKSCLFQTCIK